MSSWFNEALFAPFRTFLYPNQRTYWLYIVIAIIMASVATLVRMPRRASGETGLPGRKRLRDAFLHRSALVDYRYFFLGRILFFVLIAPLLLASDTVSRLIMSVAGNLVSPLAWLPPLPVVFALVVTLGAVVVFDFTIFITHFFLHRVPALWEFHKVHHSAEALNPLTIYRIHPFEEVLTATATAYLLGIFQAVLLFVFDPSVQILTVGQLNVFLFLFYFFGFNLRHSPAPIAYKPVLERVLISPAQHHIHHSANPEHYDRNFGFMLAIWDRMLGTLMPSSPGQRITYGLGGDEREYSSASRLFVLPIVKNIRRYRRSEDR